MIPPKVIYPDFDFNSEWARKLQRVKAEGGLLYWERMREIFAHDLQTLPLAEFKTWASVLSVPLIQWKRWSDVILDGTHVIKSFDDPHLFAESGIGYKDRDYLEPYLVFDDFDMTMNRLTMLSHLYRTQFLTQVKNYQKIVEIGAGIGEMADIICKAGFRGHYQIFDIPELHRIQKYYHEKLELDVTTSYVTEINQLAEDADLVIATFSLTEMPVPMRDDLFDHLYSSKNWLVAYANRIFGLDNDRWVQERFVGILDKPHEFINIEHMPWDGGNKYLAIWG